MKFTSGRLLIRAAVIAMALGVAVGLTGCIQSTTVLPGPTSTRSSSPTVVPSHTATPSPTATREKFVEDCNILFTPAQVYAYNPNFVLDAAFKAKTGTVVAEVATDGGQLCGWLNETSGSELEVAIAVPSAPQFAAAQTAASGGAPLDEAGEHGYFAVKDGVGSAQFFMGSIWLDVSCADFPTVNDAAAVYPIVVENQVHAGG